MIDAVLADAHFWVNWVLVAIVAAGIVFYDQLGRRLSDCWRSLKLWIRQIRHEHRRKP